MPKKMTTPWPPHRVERRSWEAAIDVLPVVDSPQLLGRVVAVFARTRSRRHNCRSVEESSMSCKAAKKRNEDRFMCQMHGIDDYDKLGA
jgi:hypothetical protein